MGFETAASSGNGVQFVSNSVCMQRGPVAIDLFTSLIFMLSVTEIQLCKVNAHFLLDERHYCMQPAFHSPNPQLISITSLFRPHSLPKTKLAVRNNFTSPRQRVYTGELKEEASRFAKRSYQIDGSLQYSCAGWQSSTPRE